MRMRKFAQKIKINELELFAIEFAQNDRNFSSFLKSIGWFMVAFRVRTSQSSTESA